ncbi:hypothetical protein BGZ76_002897 [Entomortierella beljakovae]|nr:hypothetical protein BGZ76_002897 [Entomortierella beljakovae]
MNTSRQKGNKPSAKQQLPSTPQLASSTFQFSPSSVIDRFVALRALASSDSIASTPPTLKSPKDASVPTRYPCSKWRNTGLGKVDSIAELSSPTSIPASKQQRYLDIDADEKRKSKQQKSEMTTKTHEAHGYSISSLPKPMVRPYDPLPQLEISDTHRYIATNRLLQNTTIVRTISDPGQHNIKLIERDVEYLRALLPENVKNRATTRVEADIILDESNGIILYPLREIGQSTLHNPDAGLNELLLVLGRIGPRYKVIWLILEEYTWGRLLPTIRDRSLEKESVLEQTKDYTFLMPNPRFTEPNKLNGGPIQLDPYAGPVISQLKRLVWEFDEMRMDGKIEKSGFGENG